MKKQILIALLTMFSTVLMNSLAAVDAKVVPANLEELKQELKKQELEVKKRVGRRRSLYDIKYAFEQVHFATNILGIVGLAAITLKITKDATKIDPSLAKWVGALGCTGAAFCMMNMFGLSIFDDLIDDINCESFYIGQLERKIDRLKRKINKK